MTRMLSTLGTDKGRPMILRLALIFAVFLFADGSGLKRRPAFADPPSADSGGATCRGVPLREVAPPRARSGCAIMQRACAWKWTVSSSFKRLGWKSGAGSRMKDDSRTWKISSNRCRSSITCICTTYPDREKKPYRPEQDDPLPSLWTNAELRNYFHDPLMNGSRRWTTGPWLGSMTPRIRN